MSATRQSPELLRHQALNSPGAADWFRGTSVRFEWLPSLLLTISFLCAGVLIGALVLMEHSQIRRYGGTATSESCAPECVVVVHFLPGKGPQLLPELGSRVSLIGADGQRTSTAVVLARENVGDEQLDHLVVAPAPHTSGPVWVEVAVTQPLYKWIVPGLSSR